MNADNELDSLRPVKRNLFLIEWLAFSQSASVNLTAVYILIRCLRLCVHMDTRVSEGCISLVWSKEAVSWKLAFRVVGLVWVLRPPILYLFLRSQISLDKNATACRKWPRAYECWWYWSAHLAFQYGFGKTNAGTHMAPSRPRYRAVSQWLNTVNRRPAREFDPVSYGLSETWYVLKVKRGKCFK